MNRSGFTYAAITLFLLGTVMGAGAMSAVVNSASGLQGSIIALDRARHQSVHDLAEKNQDGALDEKDQQDYEKFIVFLTVKINEYCRQLKTEEGDSAVKGLPCPEGDQAYFGAARTGAAQTSEEQVDDLEKLFSDSLGEFDEKLLKEEERLSARQPRDRESGYRYGGSQGQGSDGQTAGTSQPSGQGSGSADQQAGSKGSTGQEPQTGQTDGSSTPGGTGGSPAGTAEDGSATGGQGADSGEGAGPMAGGSGVGQSGGSTSQPGRVALDTSDDDVVARQLREAAEKETDPELKKKLWEEYRKYKEGVR